MKFPYIHKKQRSILSLTILALILLTFTINLITSSKAKKKITKNKKHRKKNIFFNKRKTVAKTFSVLNDNYYNFCTRVSDAGFIVKDQCSETYIEIKLHFPCDSFKEKILQSKALTYSLLHSKENFPTSTYKNLLEKSTCENQKGFFDKIYGNYSQKLFGKNGMRFEVKIALLRDYEGIDKETKFFENSKEVLVLNLVGNAVGLNFVFKQLNFSLQLLNNSRFAQNPIQLLDETQDCANSKSCAFRYKLRRHYRFLSPNPIHLRCEKKQAEHCILSLIEARGLLANHLRLKQE